MNVALSLESSDPSLGKEMDGRIAQEEARRDQDRSRGMGRAVAGNLSVGGRTMPEGPGPALAGRHAVISGSLGKKNLGDDLLLQMALRQLGGAYGATSVLSEDPDEPLGPGIAVDRPPPLAIGNRFWRGGRDRSALRRRIAARMPGAPIDFLWLGGLLTPDLLNNKGRLRELSWARGFCARLVYFFGDAHDGFMACAQARPIVRLIDGGENWLAVRSEEAANTLDLLGLKSEVRVGVDIFLYDLARRLGWPFRRRAEPSATMAIIPCVHRSARFQPSMLAAARLGARRGLAIRWISFCDPEDLALIRDLAAALDRELPGHPQSIHRATAEDAGLDDAACCMATRYHGSIFALAAGVPTIGLSYDPKVRNLFGMFRLHDWIAPDPGRYPPAAFQGRLDEQLSAALDGSFAPDYREFGRRMVAHEAALADLLGRRAARPGAEVRDGS